VSVVSRQVEVSAWADHSSREVLPSVVCLSDREASVMRRPWPTKDCRGMK
jgi:hypothetical protein